MQYCFHTIFHKINHRMKSIVAVLPSSRYLSFRLSHSLKFDINVARRLRRARWASNTSSWRSLLWTFNELYFDRQVKF